MEEQVLVLTPHSFSVSFPFTNGTTITLLTSVFSSSSILLFLSTIHVTITTFAITATIIISTIHHHLIRFTPFSPCLFHLSNDTSIFVFILIGSLPFLQVLPPTHNRNQMSKCYNYSHLN